MELGRMIKTQKEWLYTLEVTTYVIEYYILLNAIFLFQILTYQKNFIDKNLFSYWLPMGWMEYRDMFSGLWRWHTN